MILTTDVFYSGDAAVAVGLLHRDWKTDVIERTIVKQIDQVAPYEPGAFYKRELPCLMRLLDDVDRPLEAVIVDGYATLGPKQAPGLGWHLHDRMGGTSPVIGVAKSEFAGTPDDCRVYRGSGGRPLYITAVGMPLAEAKTCILSMHGRHRVPTLLRMVDRIGREYVETPEK